jgi:signal transduction histidine kinase
VWRSEPFGQSKTRRAPEEDGASTGGIPKTLLTGYNGGVQLPQPGFSDADLQQQRVVLHRDLRRASTAAITILLVVAVLALAAILEASQSGRHARRAQEEAARAERELWNASLAQARAERFSGQMGHRSRALDALAIAAKVRPSLELRNEAIAALASLDIEEEIWRGDTNTEFLAFDRDLAWCVTSDPQGALHILSATNRQELLSLPPRSGPTIRARFSPDRRFLAAWYPSGNLAIWDLPRRAATLETNMGFAPSPYCIDFSPDSRRLFATTGDACLRMFEAASGNELEGTRMPTVPVAIRCHPTTNHLVALAIENEVQIWDWRAWRQVGQCQHPSALFGVSWNFSGSQMAACCDDANVYLWDAGQSQPRVLSGHNAPATHAAFNHRNDLLATTAQDGTTRFWNPNSGKFLFVTYRGYAWGFSGDDARLGFMRPREEAGVWRIVRPASYCTFSFLDVSDKNIWSADLSRDDRLLLVTKRDGLRLIEVASGRQLSFGAMSAAKAAWFTPQGDTIVASGDEGLFIWPLVTETNSGVGEPSLGTPRRLAFPGKPPVQRCEVSFDGGKAVAGVGNRAAVLIDLASNTPPVWFDDSNYFNRDEVTLSPNGKWVATGTFHGPGTRVWDANNGAVLKHLGGRSASVAFSPDSRWLVAAASDEYCLWRTEDWQPGLRIHRDAIGELPGYCSFARDGNLLAIAKSHRLVQLIDPANGQELASLTASDPQMINWVRFDPGGNALAVSTAAGVVQIWDLRSLRKELAGMGLDWGARGTASGPARSSSPKSLWTALPATNLLIGLTLAGVSVALVSALVAIQWWRRLITAYERIEAAMARRNQELALTQEELIHSQKMKALGTLAAGVAHDFNNLLSIIRMSNKLVSRQSQGRPEVTEELHAIEQAVQQGKKVVNSMLGYTRSDSETVTEYSVAELIEDTMPILTRQFLSGLILTLELDRLAPPVRGSRARLEQIFLNLVVNASEAMKGEGRLSVVVRPKQPGPEPFILRPRPAARYVEMVVSDSGPGIAPEVLPRIFEPFFTTKTHGATRGTGLGLSMVYSIAQDDGLGIAIETASGQGAKFKITLPSA